ncbi:hypothetical protein GCM10010174_51200 [Kutzneria viridogrisea]|uniref:Peptidase C51 domain-containing protein n=1 Tax=Kutzneria viridogrisea TaxID=47990 RepID=A0ABR6BPG3_9PSEU|nr:hypothetical protein [Kutzneria viridogrisea]
MSHKQIRRALGALTSACVLAGALSTILALPAQAATVTDIVNLARANLGKHNCDINSLGGKGFNGSCTPEEWCADFAKWVWQNEGAQVDGLTAAAGSFYTYGQRKGTLHTDGGYRPQPGDAVVYNYAGSGYADHVGLVTEVRGDGSIQVINGNFNGTTASNSVVAYSSGTGRVGASIAGQTISGFTSPVGVGSVPRRVGVLRNGDVKVKEGNLDSAWTTQETLGTKFKVDGNRIAALRTNGVLAVKEGGLDTPWRIVEEHVTDFSLSGGRIGALRSDGTAEVKEGLDSAWVMEDDAVKQIAVSSNRVAVLRADGTVKVKEGGLDATWKHVEDRGVQIALTNSRVGVITDSGRAEVKGGNLDAPWFAEEDNAVQLELSSNRIGVLRKDGVFRVKDGALESPWTTVDDHGKQIALGGSRIGVVRTDGTVWVKEGGLDATWQKVDDNCTEVELTQE